MTITDDELKAMAVELCLLRGEQPKSVDRGGVERWERYKPLAEGALREAERLFALRQSSPPDGLDKDEQVAITEHLMMLADLDTEDAEHPPCTDFCGNRVCDQLGCVVWKYQRTHSIPTPSSETKAPGEEH